MSSRKSKTNTGLGAGVGNFFKSAESAPAQAQAKPPAPVEPVRPKLRTTVTLYNDTLEVIELLKAQSRKNGVKSTISDILNDAVELLAKERNLNRS